MVNTKRKLALAASCVAALVAMAACSGGTSSTAPASAAAAASSSDDGTSAAATSAAPASSTLAPYQIVWYMGSGNPQPTGTAAVIAKANELLKPINATLQMNVITWTDWSTKVPVLLSSGTPFDIIFTASWELYSSEISQGALLPLDDLINQYGPNITSDCGQALLNTVKQQGHIYGVPTIKDNFCGFGFIFNKKYLDKYNWDPTTLKTWADITPWLAQIKKSEPGIIPLANGTGLSDMMLPFDTQDVTGGSSIPLGMYWDNRSPKVQFIYNDPQSVVALNQARSWWNAGYLDPTAPLTNSTKITDAQTNGNCFAYVVQLKPGKAGEMSSPQVTYVQQLITDYYLQSGMGSMQGISKTSKNPERAMMFLNMLYGDASKDPGSLLNLLIWGIEGTDYTLTSTNQVQVSPNAPWNLDMPWGMGNQLNQLLSTQQPADEYTQMAQVNATAKQMYCSGFLLNQTPISAQVAAVTNACKPLNDPMSCGAVDPATTVPKILAAGNKAGLAAVQAEVQKQMDAHVAANPLPAADIPASSGS